MKIYVVWLFIIVPFKWDGESLSISFRQGKVIGGISSEYCVKRNSVHTFGGFKWHSLADHRAAASCFRCCAHVRGGEKRGPRWHGAFSLVTELSTQDLPDYPVEMQMTSFGIFRSTWAWNMLKCATLHCLICMCKSKDKQLNMLQHCYLR